MVKHGMSRVECLCYPSFRSLTVNLFISTIRLMFPMYCSFKILPNQIAKVEIQQEVYVQSILVLEGVVATNADH